METNVFSTSADLIDYLSNGVTIAPASEDQPHLDAIVAAQSTYASRKLGVGMEPFQIFPDAPEIHSVRVR